MVTAAWADAPVLARYERLIVPGDEAYAANTLLLNDRLLSPRGFPETHHLLRAAGFDVIIIDASEAQKMDGGLSCLSLRF